MPQTPRRGGGSLLEAEANGGTVSGHSGSGGRGSSTRAFHADLLTELDILYLKNVVLKFIEVRSESSQNTINRRLRPARAKSNHAPYICAVVDINLGIPNFLVVPIALVGSACMHCSLSSCGIDSSTWRTAKIRVSRPLKSVRVLSLEYECN